MTIGRTFLNGKLLVGYKDSTVKSWMYNETPYLCKVTTPDTPTEAFANFRKQVGLAIKEINTNAAGKDVVVAYQQIGAVYEIIRTTGGGYFAPDCEFARGNGYEFEHGCEGVIAWDPNKGHGTFPPWVILAHEMGHAIQLHTSGKSANAWFLHYSQNQKDVEMDNITRHETPIVKLLGLTPRTTYP